MHLSTTFWSFQHCNDEPKEAAFTGVMQSDIHSLVLIQMGCVSVMRSDMFTFSFVILAEQCFESKGSWEGNFADKL